MFVKKQTLFQLFLAAVFSSLAAAPTIAFADNFNENANTEVNKTIESNSSSSNSFEAYCTSYGSDSNFSIKHVKQNIYSLRTSSKKECLLQVKRGGESIAFLPMTSTASCENEVKLITLQTTNLQQDKLNALVEHKVGRPNNALCTVIFRHDDLKCNIATPVRNQLVKSSEKIITNLEAMKLISIDSDSIRCSCRQKACTTKTAQACSAPLYSCSSGMGSGISIQFDHNLKYTGSKIWEP